MVVHGIAYLQVHILPPGISGHLSLGLGLGLWRQDMGLAGLFQFPAEKQQKRAK